MLQSILLAFGVAVATLPLDSSPWAIDPAVPGPVAAHPSTAGTVHGRLVVAEAERPARRRVRAYGGGVTIPRAPQTIPRVVWIRGRLPGAEPGGGAMPTMAQRDTAFVPAFVTIPLGGSVSFPNGDPFFHNVFSYSASARFDLGAYPRGESKEVTFDLPGMVSVFCEVHDRMRAAILVVENPFWAEVGPEGEFEFTGVPAGSWTLVGWDPDRGTTEQEIVVVDGETLDIVLEVG